MGAAATLAAIMLLMLFLGGIRGIIRFFLKLVMFSFTLMLVLGILAVLAKT